MITMPHDRATDILLLAALDALRQEREKLSQQQAEVEWKIAGLENLLRVPAEATWKANRESLSLTGAGATNRSE